VPETGKPKAREVFHVKGFLFVFFFNFNLKIFLESVHLHPKKFV